MDSLKSPIDGEIGTLSRVRADGDVSEVESENENVDIQNDTDAEQASGEDEIEVNPNHRGLRGFLEQKVLTGQLNWAKPKEIWKEYQCLKCQSEVDKKNILHLLVDSYVGATSNKEKTSIATAFARITAMYPALVRQVDKDRQSPLYRAIVGKKFRLVDAIITKCASKSDAKNGKKEDPLSRALAARCTSNGNTENCLHIALQAGSDVVKAQALNTLARKATEDTIVETDKHGFTPLHHAVAYEKSSREQYEVIKIILKKGDSERLVKERTAVLDKFTVKDSLSVYQYHLYTRENFKEKPPTPKTSTSSRLKPVASSKEDEDERRIGLEKARQGQSQQDEKKRDAQSGKEGPGGKEGPPRDRQNQNRKDEKDGPGGARRDNRQDRGGKEEADKAEPDGRQREPRDKRDVRQNDTLGDVKSPLTRRVTFVKPEERQVSPEERKAERDLWSAAIENELKIQYLRTRTYKEAIKFLYGKNPNDTQICFDYCGLSAVADADAFEESFQNVTFDSVLQYVAFPSVKVEKWTPDDIQSDGRGRADMLFFFTWLRRKNVKRILRVIVDDHTDPPHSDEAIKQCLAPFGVEILNWSKSDLDPVTIFDASKELREVHLYWSGNNAVLRGWSEPDGLRRLPNLGVVNLSVNSTLESRACTQENLRMFEERLKSPSLAMLPGPQITAEDRGLEKTKVELQKLDTGTFTETKAEVDIKAGIPDPQQPKTAAKQIEIRGGLDDYGQRRLNTTASILGESSGSSFPSHRWLECVDQFGDRIWNVWSKILSESKDKKPEEIIVALIDDGVDNTHPPLMGRILTGRTFGYEGDRIRPWYVSERGHGTVMASMICRVCPMAKIYPIRLNTLNQKDQIDVASAAPAIEAAIDRGAHIISMSWTVAPPTGDVKKAFDKALERAIENNVLMFCSSNDTGHFSDPHYPSGYRSEMVFKIGAANPSGLPYERAGSLDKLDYIFPGVEVVQRHTKAPPGVETMHAETGSSVATALGAGLAALIMYCAKIGYMYGKVGLKEDDVQRLRRYNVMHEAITAFGASTSDQTKGKFIEVWKKLEPKTKELRRGGTQQRARDLITDLARDLVNTS